MRTDILTPGELGAYWRAHTRARLAYFKKHGSPAAPITGDTAAERTRAREHSAAWHAEHDTAAATAAERAGATAARKIHRDIIRTRDTYAALEIRDRAHLERLDRQADAARARLVQLDTGAPVDTPTPVVVKLRKGSKLEPCTRHAAYWSGMPAARRFTTAVEGGTATPCAGGACTLTPGTDRYAADLVARGPVTLAELNNNVSTDAAELEVIHAAYSRQNGSVTVSGPICAHLTMHDTREHVDTGPDAPADAEVTCHPCREILACLSPAPELVPAADVVPIRPDVDVPAPDTVPAPMPAMTRAARKATRRELAAAMRAEGLRPEGAEWRRRCAAAGLPVPVAETVR